MAAPVRRDFTETRGTLTRWLTEHLVDAEHVEITDLSAAAEGVSSETLLLGAKVIEAGEVMYKRWAVRIQATDFQVYQDPRVEKQFRIMERLGASTKVPVPRARWFEPDPSVLGAPFFVMDFVEGRLTTDSYHGPGWLADLPTAERERLWLNAIRNLALIHETDLSLVRFLDRPELGPTGLEQEIAAWNEYVDWSGVPKHPAVVRAQRWLNDHVPKQKPTGLAWGDARISNMIFQNETCVAVIDWETVSLGGAEEDVGWWIASDYFYSEHAGIERLPGLGDRATTIAAWEKFAGRKLDSMEWYELFANWRYAVISDRAIALYEANGFSLPISSGDGNPYVRRVAELLAEIA